MDMNNHINNHDDNIKFPIKNTSICEQLSFAMEDHHHHHHHHHHHQEAHQEQQQLHPLLFPLLDPVWPTTYHRLPTPDPSPPLIINQTLQGQPHDHHDQVEENDQQEDDDHEEEELGAMKEMMYRVAVMQPVDIDPATIRKPKRRNVRISDDPQSVAARHRRERISEKIRILQRLVPGGTKMDTASMLDEAIKYVKFLKRQIRHLQSTNQHAPPVSLPPSDWPVMLMGPTPSSQNPGNPIEGKVVLRDHHQGIIFRHGGNL